DGDCAVVVGDLDTRRGADERGGVEGVGGGDVDAGVEGGAEGALAAEGDGAGGEGGEVGLEVHDRPSKRGIEKLWSTVATLAEPSRLSVLLSCMGERCLPHKTER